MTSDQPPGPLAVPVSAGRVKTLLPALDEAGEHECDRSGACADCTTCRWRLEAAKAYDHMAAQMISRQCLRRPATGARPPDPNSGMPHAVTDPEAGQRSGHRPACSPMCGSSTPRVTP